MAPRDPELFTLVAAAVSEGLALLRKRIAAGEFLPLRYPALDRSELPACKLPVFSERIFGSAPDYSQAFGTSERSPIRIEGIESFNALKTYILSHDQFKNHYELDCDALREHAFRGLLEETVGYGIATELIEMYQTALPEAAFDEDKLSPLYIAVEEQVFADPLPVDFVTPILCLRFEDSAFSIADGIAIRQIPDYLAFGLAVNRQLSGSTHRIVSGAASHALFIERAICNKVSYSGIFATSEIDYPVETVDNVFSALRIVLGVSTGYAQIGMDQASWKQLGYPNPSPTLRSQIFRQYPLLLEDGYWLNELPAVTHDDLMQVRALLSSHFTSHKHFAIAKRRVNDWSLRGRPDDATLDALIGLESLLSDGQPTELTHKLAMRAAALLGRHGHDPSTASHIFERVKKIYTYRSQVVHGNDVTKVIRNDFDNSDWGPAHEAFHYLTGIIRAQAKHPKYCKPQTVDRELLLGASEDE